MAEDRLLVMRDIASEKGRRGKLPYTRVTIYKMIKDGTFPQGILIGQRRRTWWESVIDRWVNEKGEASE